ncbi:MAG: peptidoglycan-binding protein [Magnetospirillum sp.]|nr:peptidoglycan-binding protein [Magnetospirillum sp.]
MKMPSSIVGAVLLSGAAMAAEPPAPPAYAVPAEPEHGFPASLAPAYITDLQQQLVARGYYAGPVDGRMSGALRAAVSVYQSDVGLRVTGVPDLAVVNMLRFGPDVHATIQPLGAPAKPVAAAPPAAAPPVGVPPYEKVEPYRYPSQAAAVEASTEEAQPADGVRNDGAVNVLVPPQPQVEPRTGRAEEPPLPKPAPQPKVVSQSLKPAGR